MPFHRMSCVTQGRHMALLIDAVLLPAAFSNHRISSHAPALQLDGIAAADEQGDSNSVFAQAALLLELSFEEGQHQLQEGQPQAATGGDQLEHMLAMLAAAAATPEVQVGLVGKPGMPRDGEWRKYGQQQSVVCMVGLPRCWSQTLIFMSVHPCACLPPGRPPLRGCVRAAGCGAAGGRGAAQLCAQPGEAGWRCVGLA